MKPIPAGRCLLGLSGGADSVALFHLMLLLRPQNGLDMAAVHVNHGLRGADAEGDEAFARELCAHHQVPFYALQLDLKGRRDENAAREARYQAIFQLMDQEGFSTLILAHHQDDQAETFLLRLLRGAGPEGLKGMRPVESREGKTLLRPLLGISGGELREALREADLPWREDRSNQDLTYLRNRIRGELIPLMNQMAPGAAGRVARAAELIGQEEAALAEEAGRLLLACEREAGRLWLPPLQEAPEGLQRRVLRAWWRRQGPTLAERELNYDQTARLRGLMEVPHGTIINLPGNWRARREREWIRLLPPGDRTKNNRPQRK